jgi:hypothetical protein
VSTDGAIQSCTAIYVAVGSLEDELTASLHNHQFPPCVAEVVQVILQITLGTWLNPIFPGR